jgi:hypothetical protein
MVRDTTSRLRVNRRSLFGHHPLRRRPLDPDVAMSKPKKDFYRVAEILGLPTPLDSTRPNLLGGATPERLTPEDYPLYNTRKSCRVCRKDYTGLSQSPQYDDDPRLYGWCGCSIPENPAVGPWDTPKDPKPSYRHSQPPRAINDPYDP